MVIRSLSDILQSLWKTVPGYENFCRTLLLRLFQMSCRILNTPVYLYALLSLNSYCRLCFRYIQIYSSINQAHTQAFSGVSLTYSAQQHIPITNHIQTPSYIHNTILNFSTTFYKVLEVPLSYRKYLTSRVTFGIFRHIQVY